MIIVAIPAIPTGHKQTNNHTSKQVPISEHLPAQLFPTRPAMLPSAAQGARDDSKHARPANPYAFTVKSNCWTRPCVGVGAGEYHLAFPVL